MEYTAVADAGLSLDKDMSINYRYSLPNKLFDYIYGGIPVLASDLPEVRKIVEGYDVGMIISSHDPVEIANALMKMIADTDSMARWKKNAIHASGELNWEKEQRVLINFFQEISIINGGR